jgi:hypothetical protein
MMVNPVIIHWYQTGAAQKTRTERNIENLAAAVRMVPYDILGFQVAGNAKLLAEVWKFEKLDFNQPSTTDKNNARQPFLNTHIA